MKLLKSLTITTLISLSNIALAIDGTGSFTSGGITRTFAYHAPGTSIASNLPVMLVYHGDGGSGAGVKGYSGFDAVADAQNFIAVYPDAIATSWNRYVDNVPGDAGLVNPGAPDDVQFTSDLISYLCTNYHINSHKVYATGHSAGGFMAYCLAVQLSSKIAAFAPVSASLWGDNAYITNYFSTSYVPVPIYHIHGDTDGTVSYPDPDNTPVAWGEWPLSGFSYPNCGNDTYISISSIVAGSVSKLNFCLPTATVKEVSLVRIIGGGHGWPSVGGYNPALSIWNFCNSYSLTSTAICSTATGVDTFSSNNEFVLSPNPSSGLFTIKTNKTISEIIVYDVLGNKINITQLSENSYSLNNTDKGVYFIKISFEYNRYSIKKIIVE